MEGKSFLPITNFVHEFIIKARETKETFAIFVKGEKTHRGEIPKEIQPMLEDLAYT